MTSKKDGREILPPFLFAESKIFILVEVVEDSRCKFAEVAEDNRYKSVEAVERNCKLAEVGQT